MGRVRDALKGVFKKNPAKTAAKTQAHLGAEVQYLDDLQQALGRLQVASFEDNTQIKKVLKDLFTIWRALSREELREDRSMKKFEKSLREIANKVPDVALRSQAEVLLQKLEVEEGSIVKAFSRYTGYHVKNLNEIRNEAHLIYQLKKKGYNFSKEKISLQTLISSLSSSLAELRGWINGAIVTLRQAENITIRSRRGALKVAAATAVGLAALGPTFALGQSWLKLEYVTYKQKYCLKLRVHKGSSYALISKHATGSESNYPRIAKLNGDKKLKPGDVIYIEVKLLTQELRDILSENKFKRFIIDDGGSLAAIMETNVNYKKYGYNETLSLLLLINDEVNLSDPVFMPDQNIILPVSLIGALKEDADAERPSSDVVKPAEVVKPKKKEKSTSDDALIKKMALYQTPYLKSIGSIKFRTNDLFGVTRRRGNRISSKGHQGLDFPCSVGTSLYSTGAGTVVVAKDYAGGSYWRNGKAVEVRLADGHHVKYIHLSKISVSVGDKVGLGTVLGKSGITGNASSSNPHVHVQIRASKKGAIIDPKKLYEQKNYIAKVQAHRSSNKTLYDRYVAFFKSVESK